MEKLGFVDENFENSPVKLGLEVNALFALGKTCLKWAVTKFAFFFIFHRIFLKFAHKM